MSKQSPSNAAIEQQDSMTQNALRTQSQILSFGHRIVSAKDKQSLMAVAEDICAVIDALNLAVYVRQPNKLDFKLRFSSKHPQQTFSEFWQKQKIHPKRKLWGFLDGLPDKQLCQVPAKFKLGSNTFGISRRNSQMENTVLLISFAKGVTPGFNLMFLRWLYSALDKALLRVRFRQIMSVENSALNHLTNHTDESFARWKANGGWQYFNTPPIYRLGYDEQRYPLEDVFGCKALVRPSDWLIIQAQLSECKNKGEEQRCYYGILAPDGKWREMQTTLIRLSQGGQILINAVSVDITEAKEAEHKANIQRDLEEWLIAQNRKLHQQGNRQTVTSVLSDLNTRFQISRSCIFVWQDQRPRLHSHHTNCNAKQIGSISELRGAVSHLCSDMLPTLVLVNTEENVLSSELAKLYDNLSSQAFMLVPIGESIGFLLCECNDAHQWNDLEQRAGHALCDTLAMVLTKEDILEKLEASRRQFQMAMDATNYGLWELKIPEQLIKVSPNYYKMLGFERPGATEFRPIKVKNIHIDDKDTVTDQGRKLQAGLIHEVDYETRHHTKGGAIKWLQTRGRVIKWDDRGNPLRAMGTVSDITELKKTQTDLQLAYQQAEAARVAKGEFLARMSHEIRTPMNAIIGLTYMLLKSKLSEKQKAYFEDIDRAAKSLLQIIDDILDFSKIEAGKLAIEQHNFNFRKHIERVCSRFDSTAQEKGLHFAINIHDDVPHILRSDSTRIRQVLVNLLNNAFKFTNQGGVTLDVYCDKLMGNNRLLTFKVKDTGIGLDTSQIANLFDPFTQADGSRTRQYGGTGLGLSISKMLVEMMGGTIEVSSEKHTGSVFTFTVKCLTASRKSKSNLLGEDDFTVNVNIEDFKRLKVLLVEDNKVNQKVAVGMLRQMGINTTVANNGTEAVYIMKATESGEFDLILMDIEMPFMGGFEATDAIRHIARHRQVPIIAMTAHVVEHEKNRYIQAGMNNCISKPIAPVLLAQTMEVTIRNQTKR